MNLKDIQKQIHENNLQMSELILEIDKLGIEYTKKTGFIDDENYEPIKQLNKQYYELDNTTEKLKYKYMIEFVNSIKDNSNELYNLLIHIINENVNTINESENDLYYTFEEYSI